MNDYIVSINGNKKNVKVLSGNRIEFNGEISDVEFSKVSNYLYLLKADDKTYEVTAEKNGDNGYKFLIDGIDIEAIIRTQLEEEANEYLKQKGADIHKDVVKAPMPGMILKIKKNEGEEVKLGDPLIVLEAMKMENEIRSPASGIIKEINCKEGQPVEKNQVILKIE